MKTAWPTIVAAVAALSGATAVGLRRSSTLSEGDCTTAGPYDCGYDGQLAFIIALAIGGVMLVAVAIILRFTRDRHQRIGVIAAVAAAAAWVVLVIVLYIGAGEL